MLALVTLVLIGLVLVIVVPTYRRVRARDEPARLWGQEWTSTEAAAEALARTLGLAHERRRDGSSWLVSIVMAPIWLLWDPMGMEVDSMSRLAPWRLVGVRAGDRPVRVEFTAERVQIAVRCRSRSFFSVKASHDGAKLRLEEQEGLRVLHPIGGPRWQEGARLIEDAFARSVDSLRLLDDTLVAELALDERGPLPAEYPPLLESIERIAIWLEHLGG